MTGFFFVSLHFVIQYSFAVQKFLHHIAYKHIDVTEKRNTENWSCSLNRAQHVVRGSSMSKLGSKNGIERTVKTGKIHADFIIYCEKSDVSKMSWLSSLIRPKHIYRYIFIASSDNNDNGATKRKCDACHETNCVQAIEFYRYWYLLFLSECILSIRNLRGHLLYTWNRLFQLRKTFMDQNRIRYIPAFLFTAKCFIYERNSVRRLNGLGQQITIHRPNGFTFSTVNVYWMNMVLLDKAAKTANTFTSVSLMTFDNHKTARTYTPYTHTDNKANGSNLHPTPMRIHSSRIHITHIWNAYYGYLFSWFLQSFVRSFLRFIHTFSRRIKY